MPQITGLVTKINQKTKTAAGKMLRSPAYSILLDDSKWCNFGFDNPTCQEGDMIEFDGTEGQWGLEAKFSSVKVVGAGSTPAAKTATKTNDNRQESIVYQSSLKAAIDIVRLGLEQDCISLPSKKSDKLDVLVQSIHEVARGIALVAINPDFSSFGAEAEPAQEDE